MIDRPESLALFSVGLCKALDSFDGTGGGPSDGRIAAGWTGYSATVFRSKMVSMFLSAGVRTAGDGEPDLATIVFRGSVSGEVKAVFS